MLKITAVVALLSAGVGYCARAPANLDVVYGSGVHMPPRVLSGQQKQAALKQEVCMTDACQEAASSLVDAMDPTVDPCSDFYKFACGGWMSKNSIPEGKSKWGRFYELRDKVDQALHEIVEMDEPEAAAPVASLRKMYEGCLDTDTIEALGLSWLSPASDPVTGWPMILGSEFVDGSIDFPKFLGAARRNLGSDYGFSMWVYMDDLDTSKNVIYVDQPDLGLPLAMYLDEESYGKYIDAYKQYIVDIAKLLAADIGTSTSEADIKAAVDEVYQLEKMLAGIMTPDSERRNSTAMYNPMSLSELKEFFQFDWDTYFYQVFSDLSIEISNEERIIVVQPDYFASLSELVASSVDERVLANYIWARLLMKLAPETNQAMRDAAFRFNSVMTGVSTQSERWQVCTAKATGAWGFAAAHEYIMRYFDSNSKAEVDSMVEDLRAAFKELVGETDWMDSATQSVAVEKADKMLQLMGYPDWLADHDGLTEFYAGSVAADETTHFTNVVNQMFWSTGKELAELRSTPDRDVWLMHPAIVNAWYSPNHNTITFPAGILQAPFFQPGVPRYINYGAMGMVIGHEITHGFDDQGRQYDGTGNLSPWWSEETLQGFLERATCFIQQYGNYTVPELIDILGEENAHLNGKNTQGENIADNGGIHEAFRAYTKSLENSAPEPALPGLEQYTPQQIFFVSNAQVWCELQTPDSLLGQVLGDPHSPGKFRVLGPLSNSEDFKREWNCPADSPMVRPEPCKLW